MPQVIEDIFADLDQEAEQVPLKTLLEWLRASNLTDDQVSEYMVFRPDRYVRNLVHSGPAYQALLLCWRNGQRSPIHNHRGSNCAVKVLRGVATETVFDRAPNGMIVPARTRELPFGHMCASADEDMHQISNLQAADADLVTLHVYSPPLIRMDVFSLESATTQIWDDPINDPFEFGGGI